MHFVTGGAYNGKAEWVKAFYEMDESVWASAYKSDLIPSPSSINSIRYVVIEGIEVLLKAWIVSEKVKNIREKWRQFVANWMEWEREHPDRQVIFIGTDITKGIVPLKEIERIWRDIVGWTYQDTVKEATRVDIIWYGLNQQLK